MRKTTLVPGLLCLALVAPLALGARCNPGNPGRSFYPGTMLRYHPGHYLLSTGFTIPQEHLDEVATNPNFRGISRIYNWIDLEGDALRSYDFSRIDADLDALDRIGKRLIIMIRDKSFAGNPFIPVPLYMQTPAYAGGAVGSTQTGYIAKRWVPAVAERYRALIQELGLMYANDRTLEAVKTAETAAGSAANLGPEYSNIAYATELAATVDALADSFPNTVTVLYMNWFPGNPDVYLAAVAAHAAERHVGIGGPDIHPDVAIPTYDFHPAHHGLAPLMMDVQWDNYEHTVPEGDTDALLQFAIDHLFVNYVCWLPRFGFEAKVLATVANPAFDGLFPVDPRF